VAGPYLAPGGDDPGAARRSLVLAGGGMRVAYQAGVLAALDQAGLRFHHVDGTSGGTINLSMVLSGLSVADICERWRTLDARHFAAPLPWRQYMASLRWPGLGGGSGLREHVFPHLGIDPAAIRASRGVTGTYNLANFATKSSEVFEHTDVDMDLLVAGISLPVLMPAVVRDGIAYTDAVWIRDSNVPEAVRRGSDEVWLVWCIGNSPRYSGGLFRQYVHMIEMAATGSLLADLGRLAADPAGVGLRLHVIKPSFPIPLDPAYFFGRIDASALIDLGYQDAVRYLADPRPLSAPWTPEVTAMEEPAPAVTARLVVGGPFAMGSADPEAGAAVGRTRGTTFQAHLRLEAPSASPTSGMVANVAGDVEVPGWPGRVLVEQGRARLGPEPALGIDLRCSAPGGRFEISALSRPGGLAVRILEEGGGAVVGAGILPFGPGQLASVLASISPTNAPSTNLAWRARVDMGRAVWRAWRRSDG
jgi:predicted acylesterase/phospholipase RssA